MIGGSQDNGTELYVGTAIWTETDGGDGGYAKFSSTNGARVYHQIPNGSFGINFFRRSDDTGNTWVTKTASISVDVNVQNFYAPFSVDPGNGDRVLYGTNRVWETTNGGDSWAALSASGVNGFNSGGNFLDALGIAPSDVNTIYAATGGTFATSSQIFVTTNHGTAWTEHDLPVGSGRVNDIQVDPANAQTAYAVVNKFSANGHVFRTINGGTSWTNISGVGTGALPNLPVWSIQIDGSTTPSTLYIGADDGVYVSTDLGGNWSRLGTGLPNAQAFQVALNTPLRILGAATHGRGAWEIGLPGALQLTGAASSKTHGGAGTFDINLLNAKFGPECRSSGGNHTLVFTFTNNVTSGSASVTGGTGSVLGSPTFSTNTMTVNLTGVTDVQKITVTLSGVTDIFAQVLPNTAVSANMLIGDTNGNKAVSASDVAQTKGQSGATVTAANFREDINANGSVSASDIAQVKANAGHTLP